MYALIAREAVIDAPRNSEKNEKRFLRDFPDPRAADYAFAADDDGVLHTRSSGGWRKR